MSKGELADRQEGLDPAEPRPNVVGRSQACASLGTADSLIEGTNANQDSFYRGTRTLHEAHEKPERPGDSVGLQAEPPAIGLSEGKGLTPPGKDQGERKGRDSSARGGI